MIRPRSSPSVPSAGTSKRTFVPATVRSAEAPRVATTKAEAAPAAESAKPSAGFKTAKPAAARHGTKTLASLAVYRAHPLERIELIRRGIPASEAKRMFAEVPIGQGAVFKALNLSTATVNKKAKSGDVLSSGESERIVGFAMLLGQVEAIVEESGDAAPFDARSWMARWLTEPLPALGGVRPADLMDTMEGQGLVSAALARVQSGAYA